MLRVRVVWRVIAFLQKRQIPLNVKNVAICRDTSTQFYVCQIVAGKGLQGEENLKVKGRTSDVSRERCGNIVQGDL